MILVLLLNISFGGRPLAKIADSVAQAVTTAGGVVIATTASTGSFQAVLASIGAIATAPATLPILLGVGAVGLVTAALLEDDDDIS
jgi:hypothetical protein